MTKQEEIAELAEKAKELTGNLEALRQQAGHFSAAKVELQAARKELGTLIERTQALAEQTHLVLARLNEIGASKIFERLDKIESEQGQKFAQVQSGQKRLLYLVIGAAVLGLVLLVIRTNSLH